LKGGDEVVSIDHINDYYDVDMKYRRLEKLGISQEKIEEEKATTSTIFPQYKFIKLDIADKEGMNTLFEREHFDSGCIRFVKWYKNFYNIEGD
jgi:UDP-glucuronate 4-epimerase